MQKNEPPPVFQLWGPIDEAKLCILHQMEIKMEDTAFGRKIAVEKLKLKGSINNMEIDELDKLEEKIREAKRMKALKIEKKEEDMGVETEAVGKSEDGEDDIAMAQV